MTPPELWTRREHERYEDRVAEAIKDLREDLDRLAMRLTLILGGLGVLVFVVNVGIAIWLRSTP